MKDAGGTQIVRLGATDVALLRGLNRMFGEAFEDPDSYCGKSPRDEYLLRLLRDDSFIALAAIREENVVGGLAAYELKKFEQERSEIYLYDLAVAEEHRRSGVATALVEALRACGRQCGASVIFVQADKPDEGAIAFYQSITTDQQDVFHFDIPTL
jgi:aminoglycoside 3-N-acetyltransferase I